MSKIEVFSIILTKITELICLILLFSHNFNKKTYEKYQAYFKLLIASIRWVWL